MKVLFKSRNLLGDGLCATPVIKGFYNEYQKKGLEVTVLTLDDYVKVIYERIGIPVTVITEEPADEEEWEMVFEFNINKAWNVAMPTRRTSVQAYAIMLGVQPDGLLPIYQVPEERKQEAEAGLVLLQPYSRSCSSWTNEPANKRWHDESWAWVYERFSRYVGEEKVKVVGGLKDYLIPGIPESAHWFGRHLDEIAAAQGKAAFVLTIDTGPSHLAASQKAKMLELYPQCLPAQWMGKVMNPNYRMIYSRPQDLSKEFVWQQVEKMLHEAGMRERVQEAATHAV